MVISGVRRYSDEQLLAVVGACARLKFDDDMLMDKVTTQLLQDVQALDAPQLLNLVRSHSMTLEYIYITCSIFTETGVLIGLNLHILD